MIAGGTDYTGVDLPDIEVHLAEWRDNTDDAIRSLNEGLKKVEEQRTLLDAPNAVRDYTKFFIDLFIRYRSDLDRMLRELPLGVRNTHVEILTQLYESSRLEEERCIRFKEKYIERSLEHGEVRPLLDWTYAQSRDQIIDYRDLSNVVRRLRAFALTGGTTESEFAKALELKPNFFGLGINLNFIGGKLKNWWRSRTLRDRAVTPTRPNRQD